MNYRHSFHAGNFADVFKHLVLIALLKSFHKKETPFCYLDTHSGSGLYDLKKSNEAHTGIKKIIAENSPPSLVVDYLKCIKSDGIYPGSPSIAKEFLRPQDRMVLSELHPEEFKALKKHFLHDKQTAVHHQDGYQSLKAFLPPKEKRGLILIDPPYEKKDELETLEIKLSEAINRFETGVFALWYPIKDKQSADRFIIRLKEKISRPVFNVEFMLYPDSLPTHLNGCGMFIVNPPWKLDEELESVMKWLKKCL